MLRPGLLLAALALTRAEHSVLVRGRAGVPIYSPQPHLLAPTAAQQRRLERFGGVGLRPKAERVHHPENEVFFRQYPVEETFFRSFAPAPCTLIAKQVPPSDVKCDHAPKYSCGPLSALRRIDGCQVWSVGSNSQTCFERFVHAQAPNCAIHTFDPTLGPRAARQLRARLPFATLHEYGLSGADTDNGSLWNWHPSRPQPHTPTRLRSLRTLMRQLNASWVDYLKVISQKRGRYCHCYLNRRGSRWPRLFRPP